MIIYTKAQLEAASLTVVTTHYQTIAKDLMEEFPKKFRDKKTAVERTLVLQDRYVEIVAQRELVKQAEAAKAKEEAVKAVKAVKPAKTEQPAKVTKLTKSGIADSTKLKVNQDKLPKMNHTGSILSTLVKAIDEEMLSTVGEVVAYVTANHTRPRFEELADASYAKFNINWAIKKGYISIVE